MKYRTGRLRLLLVMEQCNPAWPSVPLVAFHLYDHLRRLADVTLVTHERNREGLRSRAGGGRIDYIAESPSVARWYRTVHSLTSKGATNWPLQHALGYPVYADFNRKVYRRHHRAVRDGHYDAVIAATPILPRYPYAISRACAEAGVPFILGPVNGGLPFPKGFEAVARKESARFNALRLLGRLLPGYVETYRRADKIIAGSEHTRDWIREAMGIPPGRLELLAENGVSKRFFERNIPAPDASGPLRLIFAGRLVPYKGCDMVIDALATAQRRVGRRLELKVVGDGSERPALERRCRDRGVSDRVTFIGQVPPESMAAQFAGADVFAFPSIREFGGAVALEAMASGLPSLVVDHGGLGEYVTPESGWKIPASSRETIVAGLADAICTLAANPSLQARMARQARERALGFAWEAKVERLLEIVTETIASRTLPVAC
ncbi:MAG: glycosyltransferase family 4 protein [Verrucomicrobiae bacterium]|nr:glycosyltransferase family 4 protein [Verrucomicrobiae bacterium]MCB1085443.1 glycosyltransferase family 4 protein [Verrucomicrobiae bacterium]MCB1089885.1 glycosyltransferase family 4 protein [Verrucomicrobiae bacterium]